MFKQQKNGKFEKQSIHKNVRLAANSNNYLKLVWKPRSVSQMIFNENLVAVHKIKLFMYGFYYDYIKNKYGDKAKPLFTDTDSLVYEIETNDVYEDFYVDKEIFDFSEYSKDSKFHDTTNKKVIGKLKDERKGILIVEFVGFKSKVDSFVKDVGLGDWKAEGINRNVVTKTKHVQYQDVFFGE